MKQVDGKSEPAALRKSRENCGGLSRNQEVLLRNIIVRHTSVAEYPCYAFQQVFYLDRLLQHIMSAELSRNNQ